MARAKNTKIIGYHDADETEPVDAQPGDGAPPAPAAAPSLMARAVSLAAELRALLIAAESERVDRDATSDAGHLAEALLADGGALADEQQPWGIKHALDRELGHADPDGTERLARFIGGYIIAIKQGTRRKALGLGPQRGLAVFARVAVKHDVQRTAMLELEQERRDQEADRQHVDRVAHEARGARRQAPARKPDGPEPPDADLEPEDDDAKV